MEKVKCIFEKVQRIVNGIIGLMLFSYKHLQDM